jgi:hypothetical protein
MPAFLYRCPKTGMTAQGFTADEPSDSNPDIYEPIKCVACAEVHLINPRTRKVTTSGVKGGRMAAWNLEMGAVCNPCEPSVTSSRLALPDDDGLPNACPIAFSDSPRHQRSHNYGNDALGACISEREKSTRGVLKHDGGVWAGSMMAAERGTGQGDKMVSAAAAGNSLPNSALM